MEQKTYEQYKEEMIYTVGASSVGTIMGANKYSSPYRLYLETREEIERFQGNEKSEIGSFFENTIIDYFLKDHPELTEVTPKSLSERLSFFSTERNARVYVHHEIPFLSGIPDRICYDRDGNVVVLEAKNTGEYMAKDWEYCPMMAYYQTLTYLDILNAQYGYVIGLIGGNKFITHKIERNDEEMENVRIKVKDFYRRLIDSDPPDVSAIDKGTIEEQYPEIEEVETEFPYNMNSIFEALDELKLKKIELNEYEKQLKNNIRHHLGQNSAGVTDRWRVTQKEVITNRLNTRQLKSDFNEIYEKCLVSSTSRRLIIKKIGD